MIQLAFDVEGAKAQLTQVFRDRLSAQGSVWNLENVNIEDVTFDDLKDKIPNQDQLVADLKACLATAKTHGLTWSNEVQPQLTVVPQAAINFASTWNNAVSLILDFVQGSQSPESTAKLIQLFGGLNDRVQAQITDLQNLTTTLQTMRKSVAADADNFSNNHASFQQLEAFDKENIHDIRVKLASLKLSIDALNQEISVENIKAEDDISIASNAMKYGGKLGRPGKIIGLTIGLIFIVMASVAIDELISAVNQRLQEEQAKAEYQFEMTLLAIQLLALEAASSALSGLVADLDDLIASIQQNINGWTLLSSNLTGIASGLQAGQPVSQVVSLFDLGRTQGEWDELLNFATKWQNMEIASRASNDLILTSGAAS
jgi:signal transduction histidine kinase